ncbi:MAG: phosphoribosylformylglycinamidine synthase, partial [Bacteroidota bacterium]
MIQFFGDQTTKVFAVQTAQEIAPEDITKLTWLFGNQPKINAASLDAFFIGPRSAMITPWSTNATEITQNMGIRGILRIEEFHAVDQSHTDFDPMLFQKYDGLNQEIYTIDIVPESILEIDDIAAYNEKEGLALSNEEIKYLEELAEKIGRKLTDSEVFGFSQVNSEHCRHKIFNGTFVIDGEEKPSSLFKMIKKTSEENPNGIVSAYKDNVAFIDGPKATQFAPKTADEPDFYEESDFNSVLSLKAETHNFPTTVEPFNGAATGSGGEIRDRLAGGKGSLPLAGTAVYMTSYSRLEENRPWENGMVEREWLYQTPMDILIKASNGASDFGNKFGQPLIAGSVLTFEHQEEARKLGFDKVIMLAGGIGYGKKEQALKDIPKKEDRIVILGGDNYRIGMGGAAVSSADTGEFSSAIELNAVQRSNPEMQKRASNAIRGLLESHDNPIVSIHDHGAGGHLNCLSELVEETGGTIDTDKLPVGDPTLSAKELIGNESQERMGLVIGQKDMDLLDRVAARERSPMYNVGKVTGDHRFTFASKSSGEKPMDLELSDMFGSSPKTIIEDTSIPRNYPELAYSLEHFHEYLEQVLQLEAVACKDWLTNKVDRCVGGRVAKQQCVGPLQLPLNNCGVMALDFKGKEGLATSIGHSPISALVDPVAGSRNSIAEALTNIIWAPLQDGLQSVSLSANWMWPCKNEGEDARLYEAVKAVSDFSIDLGINVPTGKDSLSMKQKYKNEDVISPGTVIISAAAHCNDLNAVVEPVLQKGGGNIYYINVSQDSHKLGGSSFAQILNKIGNKAPTVDDAAYLKKVFNSIQSLIGKGKILAGHDVASGGLITTLLEMCFADVDLGAQLDLSEIGESDSIKLLFAENAGIVFQASDDSIEKELQQAGIKFTNIGSVTNKNVLTVKNHGIEIGLNIPSLRDTWFKTSYLLDGQQTANGLAKERYDNYKNQSLKYRFPKDFDGTLPILEQPQGKRPKAAIIREKGSNSEREMANAMFLAGFD